MLVRGFVRIVGRDNIRILVGLIIIVDVIGYWGLLFGEESCIFVEFLRDCIYYGLIIVSIFIFVYGKYVKVKVVNVGWEDVWFCLWEWIGIMYVVFGV